MDIRELLLQMRAGWGNHAIARATGIHRQTIRRYRAWAAAQGLLTGDLPPRDELARLVEETLGETKPPQNLSSVEPYRAVVVELHGQGLKMTAIYQRLKEREFKGSYQAVRRFVDHLQVSAPEIMVRVECAPGEEAQVDFGFAGYLPDPKTGKRRRAWAFIMTLSWSRHMYAEIVFDQTIETWLLCHRHALEAFGGVPARVVIDNLKAAIVKAVFDDPLVQWAYREEAECYSFLIAPCRPRTPRHKGKVERSVDYVKNNFLAGRDIVSVAQVNQDLRLWCNTTAGQRIHGTTKEQPLVRFEQVERACLKPLPEAPYDMGVWKEVTVGADGYVTFQNAYYSVPCRLAPRTKLWLRGGTQFVSIYTPDHQLVAMHDRAQHPGERVTHLDHLPPHKVAGLLANREDYQAAANDIGPATGELVAQLLGDPVIDRLRTVGRLLRLRETHGDTRLEAACVRALAFDEVTYSTVKRILLNGLEKEQPVSTSAATPPAHTFVRGARELLGHVFGGVVWN